MSDHEFLWCSGRFAELPLLELVQEVPGPRSREAWTELVRREECWRAQSDQLADAKRNEERAVGELHTLEDAVRAVHDEETVEERYDRRPSQPLSKLFALVPDGGGS